MHRLNNILHAFNESSGVTRFMMDPVLCSVSGSEQKVRVKREAGGQEEGRRNRDTGEVLFSLQMKLSQTLIFKCGQKSSQRRFCHPEDTGCRFREEETSLLPQTAGSLLSLARGDISRVTFDYVSHAGINNPHALAD